MKLILLAVFFVKIAAAQKQEIVTLIPEEMETKIQLPYSGIEIVDARFDQTNIGSFFKNIQKPLNTRAIEGEHRIKEKFEINFPDSMKSHLPVILNKLVSFDTGKKEKLLILVKQFRLVDWVHLNEPDAEMVLTLSCSFFSQVNDQLTKVGAMDNLFSEPLVVARKKNVDTARAMVFGKILTKVLNNISWEKTGLSFSKTEMEAGIEKRFLIPIFKDSIKKAGVYRTFSEFISNSPSVTQIKVRHPESRHTIIKDSTGKILDPEMYWGACDGKNFYIVFRKVFYKMEARDRSFIIRSFRSTADQRPPAGYGAAAFQYGLLGAADVAGSEFISDIFYVNMNNGEIYLEEIFGTSPLKKIQKDILKKQSR
jgi:hypothetical protein